MKNKTGKIIDFPEYFMFDVQINVLLFTIKFNNTMRFYYRKFVKNSTAQGL